VFKVLGRMSVVRLAGKRDASFFVEREESLHDD